MNRKLFALALAILLPLGLLAGSGDVNGDGHINVGDIVEILNYIENHPSVTFNESEADVNNDGSIDYEDVDILKKKIMNEPFLIVEQREVKIRDTNEWQQFVINVSTNEFLMESIKYKIVDDANDWIELNSDMGISYLFSARPNISGENRKVKIAFYNDEYDLHDTAIVVSDPTKYIEYEKKEFHVINCFGDDGNRLFLETKNNIQWSDLTITPVEEDVDWIEPLGGYDLKIKRNETGKVREAHVEIKNDDFNVCDVIHIIQYPGYLGNMSPSRHILVCQPSGDIVEIPIVGNTTLDVEVENMTDYMHLLPAEIRGKNKIIRIEVDANESEEERREEIFIKVGDNDPQYFLFAQAGKSAPSFEEQKEALVALYNSTNGDHWRDHNNWLTDMPINTWYGVNNSYGDSIIGNYIVEVNLQDNKLVGEIPSQLSLLMDAFKPASVGLWYGGVLNVEGNGLYGKIPDAVRNASTWSERGWGIVLQSPYLSGGRLLECDDWGLKLDDYEVDDVKGNFTSSKDLLSKYNLSTITIGYPSDDMINLHMSYQNKGYGTIYSAYDWYGGTKEELVEAVQKAPIDIEGVWQCDWAYKQLSGLRALGTWFVFDGGGNLQQCLYRDWDVPESWYASKVDSICRAHLGEPEEHEPYSSTYYESEDYTQDGVVLTLQQHTVGKGIDIVFMGDAYVDKDMDEGGKYETDMRQGMECFFAVEPYKTLRDRFNVYAVKVVSKNDHIGDGCEQKLNYNDEICFSYAQKVEGIDMDNVSVVNIVNNPNDFFVSGVTNMYETGSSVAHIEKGGPSSIIVHEAGGHGFAKLLDEYIYGGYEENHTQEGENEGFRNWIKTEYHDKGWGMNISATDNADEVPWAHFLKDDRYKDEIGIYKGAWLWPEELWRPSENSVMNNDYTWFNAPSREVIYKRIMKLSEGDEWEYNYETFVTFDAPVREAHKAVQSRSRARGTGVQQRRIESRPPTIYKGTWRDAGKCEKIEYTSR